MSIPSQILIRNAEPAEFEEIGQLMVAAYSQLEGFPNEMEQPHYYKMLRNVGDFTEKPETELLVAADDKQKILGAVVYFGDMHHYGSGGLATQEKDAAGFRLLAVRPDARGLGIGKLLTMTCLEKAKSSGRHQVILHTTKAMMNAWSMYEKIGFRRSEDLDFRQGDLAVVGFRFATGSVK